MAFEGFSQQTVDFMWDIRFNNERSWFLEHKDIYLKSFYEPMCRLSDELYAHVRALRPNADIIHKTSRIYRDARRLHGRGPYKDNLWISIEPPCEEWEDIPSFWFDLSPDHWSYGMGYPARPTTMEKLRTRIDRAPDDMMKLMGLLEGQDEFALTTSDYKRSKREAPRPELAVWYRAKRFWFEHEGEINEELFSRDIVERLKKGYTFLMPFFDYFLTLSSEAEPKK